MTRQIDCVIYGRVQGVLYRVFSRKIARETGLVGTVENLPDGTVKLVAQGDEALLKGFIERLKTGSVFSRVAEVKVSWSIPKVLFQDFRIK